MYMDILYRDYNGQEARTRHYPPPAATFEETVTGAIRLVSLIDAVTSAEIVSIKIVLELDIGTTNPVHPDASVYTRLLLLFREGQNWASVSIPSPSGLPFDEGGAYAGIRLQRAALDLSGMLEEVERLCKDFVPPTGIAGNYDFVVGGIMDTNYE